MAPPIYTIRTPTNPILQVLYFLVGGVLLIGAVIAGAFVLAIVLGLAVIFGIVIYIRIWWLKRKWARSAGAGGQSAARQSDAEVLEVEYTVVREEDEDERQGR